MKITLTPPQHQLINTYIANKVFFHTVPLAQQIAEEMLGHSENRGNKILSKTIRTIHKMSNHALLDLLKRNNCIILRPGDIMPPKQLNNNPTTPLS